jgi:hypothetical protein
MWAFAPEAPQRPDFDSAQKVVTAIATFDSLYMEDSAIEVEVVPAKPKRLGQSKAVGEHQEQQGRVALTPASFAGGIDQKLDLGWGQVFAVARPSCGHCSLYSIWGGVRHGRKVLDTATVA